MRALRYGFTGAVCHGALRHALRRVLDAPDDEMLSTTIRALLRRHGPLPLPRVTSLLSDEALEVLARVPGGLRRYLHDRASRFRVETLPSGVCVAILSSDVARAGDGARIVAQVLAHVAASPQQRLPVAQLFRDLPAAEQRLCGSAARLEAFLLRHPDAVRVAAGVVLGPAATGPTGSSGPTAALGAIGPTGAAGGAPRSVSVISGRAADGAPPLPLPPAPNTNANTNVNVADDPRMLKLLALLYSAVPCSCYVPLRALLRHPRRYMCIEAGAPLCDVLEALRRVPAAVLDCRVMSDGEDDVFLRMVDAERRAFLAEDCTAADTYDVLEFGGPLKDAFVAFAARGPREAQRVREGIAMAELHELLPPELLRRMRGLYGTARGGGDATCIFVFDRLRHVFDVSLAAYRARPWAALSPRDQPSSLTWLTTPTPVVLRHALEALEARPLSPAQLTAALPARSQRQLSTAYGCNNNNNNSNSNSNSNSNGNNDNGNSSGALGAVEEFVARHSLYLVAQDGYVLTPYHAAATQGARVPAWQQRTKGPGGPTGTAPTAPLGAGHSPQEPLSEAQRARMLMATLPMGHPVDWQRHKLTAAVRALPFDVHRLRPEFFERHRNCFATYEVLGTSSFIVGRRDGKPPPPHLLQQPCRSLADLVRLMALFSVGGAQEGSIVNFFSKDARLLMRRYGTLEHIARQLPMWFDVRNERQEPGSAFISYIGAGAQPTDVDTEKDN